MTQKISRRKAGDFFLFIINATNFDRFMLDATRRITIRKILDYFYDSLFLCGIHNGTHALTKKTKTRHFMLFQPSADTLKIYAKSWSYNFTFYPSNSNCERTFQRCAVRSSIPGYKRIVISNIRRQVVIMSSTDITVRKPSI